MRRALILLEKLGSSSQKKVRLLGNLVPGKLEVQPVIDIDGDAVPPGREQGERRIGKLRKRASNDCPQPL
jgi:hypothetical protein